MTQGIGSCHAFFCPEIKWRHELAASQIPLEGAAAAIKQMVESARAACKTS